MGYAYKIADGGAVYFVTCTVNKRVDVFTRKLYIEIITESLNYCISNKGLIIYGYVRKSFRHYKGLLKIYFANHPANYRRKQK